MKFTVIGANGFIGSALCNYLNSLGAVTYAVDRNIDNFFSKSLGNVIYAAGITSDFRKRRFETMEAHVSNASYILKNYKFDSFLYLSSSRVYRYSAQTHENASVSLRSCDIESLYDISKLAGEAICFSIENPKVRVVRLSNIISKSFNSGNFLDQIVGQSLCNSEVKLRSSLKSEKDYLTLDDAVENIVKISLYGKERCYNLAAGKNISNLEIVNLISTKTEAKFIVDPSVSPLIPNKIDVSRLKNEFNFKSKNVLKEIERGLDGKLNK